MTLDSPASVILAMKILIIALFGGLAVSSATAVQETPLPLPTRAQAEWQDAGIGIFAHWAPNVYQGTQGDNVFTPSRED